MKWSKCISVLSPALSQVTHPSCFAMETSVFFNIIKSTLKLLQKLLYEADYKQMSMCIF